MMRTTGKSWLWLAGLLAGMVGALAAEFAAPAEGPVPFRRDRIPLEANAMAGLSRHLETLARGLDAKTAASRRGAAQMLALALALDPANANARNLVSEFEKGRPASDPNAGRVQASRARIRELIAWLESPEAGTDGQALAACLKDVMILSDSGNPKADALRSGGEQGAWAGWIPDVSAYATKVVISNDKPKAPSEPEAGPPPKKRILLEQAEVQTPLWQAAGRNAPKVWMLKPAPLRMSATTMKPDQEGGDAFSITFGNSATPASMEQLGDSLKVLLRKHHGALPKGVRIQITSNDFEKSLQSNKLQSISAASAVLASSAITGREPDSIIIGQVDEVGSFTLPTRFWYQLQALGKGNGQRLVLPADALEYLNSILAMEKPEFFLEYEVVLASDFKQLLDFSARQPEEPLASATGKFREIRERAGSLDVRTYIGNSFVKQRLAAVLRDLPAHVSARMLLIQASGDRPVWVSRKVLAAELRLALEPISTIRLDPGLGLEVIEAPELGDIHEICRTKVDALERYTEKQDRELWEQAREVVAAVRSLDKASRSRPDADTFTLALQSARTTLNRQYAALIEKLAAEIGEPPPAKGP